MDFERTNMNHPSCRLGFFASLASLMLSALAAGCTQTDSLGNGGKADASAADSAVADGPLQSTGGAPGVGGGGMGGRIGSGGALGTGGSGTGGSTKEIDCSGPNPAAVTCLTSKDECVPSSCTCSGENGWYGWMCTADCRTTSLPLCDTGADASTSDTRADGASCSGPSPAQVTCLASKNQCVPSVCYCSTAGTWACTADCPVNSLPLCDAGTGPDGNAPDVDAADARTGSGFDAGLCSGPNPALVDCLMSPNQCVPSTCSCSPEHGWTCTTDCRAVSLPMCPIGGKRDGGPDAATPDAAPDLVPAEAPMPANYSCRDDSDCCTVVDTCYVAAYLYSKAPGATGKPSFPPHDPGMCLPCISPAVQVRCDQGQCVGEKIETGVDYNSPLRKDHCGPVALPDAGAALMYQPAYMATQQTSWGC